MTGSAEEAEPHLIMYVSGVPVGRLYAITSDMFWNKCRFEPLDARESVRPLFEQHEGAAKQGFPIDKTAATKEILGRPIAQVLQSTRGHVTKPFPRRGKGFVSERWAGLAPAFPR
ncbi:hypothetical protein ACFCX5_40125, partial [Streptomyces sp. NPDC056304]